MCKLLIVLLIASTVLIACSDSDGDAIPKKYSIGGEVQALNGDLVLEMNGDQRLTISSSSDSKYEFETKLFPQQAYRIEIVQQPESQTCRFIDPETSLGNVLREGVDSIHIRCIDYRVGLKGATEIASGFKVSCATNGTKVICWSQKGTDRVKTLNVPDNLINPRELTLANDEACVLDDEGLKCWGYTVDESDIPTVLQNPRNLVMGGLNEVCVTDDTGLHCWSFASSSVGALTHFIPEEVNQPDYVAILARGYYACAIQNSVIYCWGSKVIDLVDEIIEDTPTGFSQPQVISLGLYHACALEGGDIKCWGRNDVGQLDLPDDLGLVEDVASDGWHSCVIADSKVRCWGGDYDLDRYAPEIVTNPTKITTEQDNMCVISNSQVVCWGGGDSAVIAMPQEF